MRKPISTILSTVLFLFVLSALYSCTNEEVNPASKPGSLGAELETGNQGPAVTTGAEILISKELDKLKGKRIAIVANQTSMVFGSNHLVDTLHALGIEVKKVFAPEHGFRGDHDAGAKVSNSRDEKTGIKIESLYGSHKKPSSAQLADVDLVLFDIQDVGARFYTYISTLAYVMEACAEQKKPVMVLDRPNPNGWYVDGPVLEKGLESFVGMHPVPIVHGMTVGEYAKMVNGEGWMKNKVKCILEVIKCENYDHNMNWEDTRLKWVAPSPNLATAYSAYLYPAFCWMEGMPVSVGRGTDEAFSIFGAPWHEGYRYQLRKDSAMELTEARGFQYYGLEFEYAEFTPVSMPGKAGKPKFMGQPCYGARPMNMVDGQSLFLAGVALLKNFEEEAHNVEFKKVLFKPFFTKLAGSRALIGQIKKKMPEKEIHESWQPAIGRFKMIRRKYLLYPDFEAQG